MPSGGLDLSRPPVRIQRGVASKQLTTLLAGVNLYSMGAGGFGRVPALPNMVRLRQPASPNTPAAARYTQIYATRPLPTKQQIRRQFGSI